MTIALITTVCSRTYNTEHREITNAFVTAYSNYRSPIFITV